MWSDFQNPGIPSDSLAIIYSFKVNIRKRCEICSKLKIKTSEQYQWPRSAVSIVNLKHIHFFWCFYCWLWINNC